MPKRDDRTEPKSAALLQEGTLNSSPEAVIDPKFQPGGFFDPRDLVQVRYEMLRRVSVDNQSITQATVEYGVSRPTYYQAKASFDEAGVTGLVPKEDVPPAGTPVTLKVTGLLYPPMEPMLILKTALLGWQTPTLVLVTDRV